MRCFVSIDLEPGLREKVAEIQTKLALPGLKMVKPEGLHITLKFLGELDEQQVNDVVQKLHKVKFTGFGVNFAGIGVFPDPRHIRVVWIGIESKELGALAKQVAGALVEYESERMQDFKAHLTLARVDRHVPGLAEKIESMKKIEIGKQHVSCFKLKKSVLTRNGPIYSDIEVFGADV
jgi:2'-5' RNA ligase